jgi:CRISPR system Cascade subunit CasB
LKNSSAVVLQWWNTSLNRETSLGRALSARLRRASAIEILCEPKVHELAQELNLKEAERLVRLVSVLSEVRENTKPSLASILGGSVPVLSNLRFQKLMRASEGELVAGLKRAIRIAKYRCNIEILAGDLMFWNEQTRSRWCFNYFSADPPNEIPEETIK